MLENPRVSINDRDSTAHRCLTVELPENIKIDLLQVFPGIPEQALVVPGSRQARPELIDTHCIDDNPRQGLKDKKMLTYSPPVQNKSYCKNVNHPQNKGLTRQMGAA